MTSSNTLGSRMGLMAAMLGATSGKGNCCTWASPHALHFSPGACRVPADAPPVETTGPDSCWDWPAVAPRVIDSGPIIYLHCPSGLPGPVLLVQPVGPRAVGARDTPFQSQVHRKPHGHLAVAQDLPRPCHCPCATHTLQQLRLPNVGILFCQPAARPPTIPVPNSL
jgi:hypothetical protein